MRATRRFGFSGLVVLVSLTVSTAAQPGKKVYISADMEGISGIVGDDQVSAGGAEYGRSRKLMAEDVNAAIRGALAAGATEIVVNDSHGSQRNLLPEDLDPSARLISHSFKRFGMMEGLDETFDAVIFIGYHAKADTPAGLFAHTGSGVLRDLQIDGRSVGEGGMNTMLAAWYGVPVVLVTGDDVAVAQVKEVATASRGVVVKRAINVRAAELRSLRESRKEIEAAARDAVAGAKKIAAARPTSVRVRMRYRNFTYPEIATAFPMIKPIEPDTIEFTSDTMPAAYRLIRVLYRFINPD
jgi:D-amino peptidase